MVKDTAWVKVEVGPTSTDVNKDTILIHNVTCYTQHCSVQYSKLHKTTPIATTSLSSSVVCDCSLSQRIPNELGRRTCTTSLFGMSPQMLHPGDDDDSGASNNNNRKRGATAEAAEPSNVARRSHSHDALHQAAVAWHQSLDVESRVATIPKRGTPAKKKQRSHCKTHSWHDWLQAAQLIGLISAQHSIESAVSIGNPLYKKIVWMRTPVSINVTQEYPGFDLLTQKATTS